MKRIGLILDAILPIADTISTRWPDLEHLVEGLMSLLYGVHDEQNFLLFTPRKIRNETLDLVPQLLEHASNDPMIPDE